MKVSAKDIEILFDAVIINMESMELDVTEMKSKIGGYTHPYNEREYFGKELHQLQAIVHYYLTESGETLWIFGDIYDDDTGKLISRNDLQIVDSNMINLENMVKYHQFIEEIYTAVHDLIHDYVEGMDESMKFAGCDV